MVETGITQKYSQAQVQLKLIALHHHTQMSLFLHIVITALVTFGRFYTIFKHGATTLDWHLISSCQSCFTGFQFLMFYDWQTASRCVIGRVMVLHLT